MSPGAANQSKKHVSAREALAANIVALRHERGWSQEALAFECGLHRTFVAHVERLSRNISLDNVERLALALGVEPFELLKPRSD
ncbi:helix-turn-helix transcriptional regulator [Ideonella sp. 4Y16]|jgi:transcriptional regulator with XRE-family HTH domain|uniref:helix-turn-helix domain-containing protein n=1 Tax=Ideonella alba TaxID=2824118 RepID=UPI001B39AD43|nr:helix-turn-helix transcriptional regulator [Ideonella alba]MBQ0942621.1 helix-turn-helix transcriptional regulator [Ideonella alba]MCI1711414.1 helix-turn-helix transcriptional regulator [Chiayiivirga sp.]